MGFNLLQAGLGGIAAGFVPKKSIQQIAPLSGQIPQMLTEHQDDPQLRRMRLAQQLSMMGNNNG